MSARTHDEDVHRVTALALGLAFAAREATMAVEELIHAAGGRVEVLNAAGSRVAGLSIGDHDTHRRAGELLREAVARRRKHVPDPSPASR
ncbi:MAG: hypothetical protein KY437_08905 [Actinobacteria bacterium]|nr:hypothetical protein [Actinomycetota bacterium]